MNWLEQLLCLCVPNHPPDLGTHFAVFRLSRQFLRKQRPKHFTKSNSFCHQCQQTKLKCINFGSYQIFWVLCYMYRRHTRYPIPSLIRAEAWISYTQTIFLACHRKSTVVLRLPLSFGSFSCSWARCAWFPHPRCGLFNQQQHCADQCFFSSRSVWLWQHPIVIVGLLSLWSGWRKRNIEDHHML